MKKIIILIVVFFILQISIYGNVNKNNILILPFRNTGSIEYDYFSDLIPTYFFSLLKDLPDYMVVSLYRIKKVLNEKGYKTLGLANQKILSVLKDVFNCHYIIGGEFLEEDSELIIHFYIYNTIKEKARTEIIKGILKYPVIYTLDDLFLTIIEEFTGNKIESGFVTVKTDIECMLKVDGEYYGKTPIKMRLSTGEHLVSISHKSIEKEEIILTKKISIESDSDAKIEIKVFVQLDITADTRCSVYINNIERGITPFSYKLYSGKDYLLKVEYTDKKNNKYEVHNNIISTKTEDDIVFHFSEKGNIIVKDHLYPLFCNLNDNSFFPIPHKYENIDPGKHRIKVVLKDEAWKKNWMFLNRDYILESYQDISIDLSFIDFQKKGYLCFIPSYAQFYNREPGKGIIILSLFSGSLATSAISLFVAQGFIGEYLKIAEPFEREGIASGYTSDDVEKAHYPVKVCDYIFKAGLISAVIIYLYSMIDGDITMNHLNNILNK